MFIRPSCAQPFQPPRREAERLLGLRIRRPAEPGAVVHRVLAGGRPSFLLTEHRRRRRPNRTGERGQPDAHRGGVVIDDMIHARRDRQGLDRGQNRVVDVDPRPDRLALADDRDFLPPDQVGRRALGVIPRPRAVNPDFPDGSVVSAWRLRLFPGKPSVSDDFLPKRQRNPMGDSQNNPLRVDFDRQIKLEFHGSTVTSDAGLLAYRELDNALGLTSTAASGLLDTRTGQNTRHGLLALLRQSLYSRLAGYEDVNDAERLCLDPAMRIVVGGRAKDQTAASTSEMARFETETLSTKENLKHLIDLSGKWIDQAHRHRKYTKLILDIDSSVSETYGHQEGSAYNGYFACTCYHPLFLFNQFGDLERVLLRRGNHPSAKFWRRVLLPVIGRYQDRDIPKFFRGDSAFALPKLLRLLEKEGFRYAIRLKA